MDRLGGTRPRNISNAYRQPTPTILKSQVLESFEDASEDQHVSSNALLRRLRRKMRTKQLSVLVAIFIVLAIAAFIWRQPLATTTIPQEIPLEAPSKAQGGNGLLPEASVADPSPENPPIYEPLPAGEPHPISKLIAEAERNFEEVKKKQSKSLAEAVAEYRRRYGTPPPPNFDKWYEFAKKKNVQLIDEYDSIHESLTPFWGLEPSTIRHRAKEAIGFDNALIAVIVRDGKITKMTGGEEWQKNATKGMMAPFLKYLPDMDLAFNIHDEPRVVVPHDDLSRLVHKAKGEAMPASNRVVKPRNSWSARPKDMNDGSRIEEFKTTRFNRFAHQPTWTESRMSCPPGSPARSLEENPKDDTSAYGLGELSFVHNHTAFSDICNSPSFSSSYGFFDRPNAFNIAHDLFPIFSQSKISSFQDIVYPSPWYWYGKVKYNESKDMMWVAKEDKMYWRGSTTGGFSRDGGWRRQHRQQMVTKINAVDNTAIFTNSTIPGSDELQWSLTDVPRSDYHDLFDIQFSSVGQCDPGDCQAQEQFFTIVPSASQQDAWKYKYLIDIDGNAFSGRFYAFLKSRSLVYKMAIFREWHEEWIKPWVHYIPWSLKGDEWVESVRYFEAKEKEAKGGGEAERLAMQGREWAKQVLRNEDFEVWFFRLLLE